MALQPPILVVTGFDKVLAVANSKEAIRRTEKEYPRSSKDGVEWMPYEYWLKRKSPSKDDIKKVDAAINSGKKLVRLESLDVFLKGNVKMKKSELRQIIKEEIYQVLSEGYPKKTIENFIEKNTPAGPTFPRIKLFGTYSDNSKYDSEIFSVEMDTIKKLVKMVK